MPEPKIENKPKKPARRRSGGPRSAEGKAIASRNSLTHGLNSELIVIDGESAEDFEYLFQGLVDDFHPQGVTETLILHRIATLIWKQRRLDRFEHHQVSQAALAPIKIAEIFKKMNCYSKAEKCEIYFDGLDQYDESDLEKSDHLIGECSDFLSFQHHFQDPEKCHEYFPILSQHFSKLAGYQNMDPDILYGLGNPEALEDALLKASEEVTKIEKREDAIYFLITNRDEIYRTRAAIRAEKMSLAWNLERSHRYHSLLESQLFRALKELRSQQLWRASQTKRSEIDSEGQAVLEDVLTP